MAFFGALKSQEEIEEEEADELCGEGPLKCVICGPPGVGKTSLLRSFVDSDDFGKEEIVPTSRVNVVRKEGISYGSFTDGRIAVFDLPGVSGARDGEKYFPYFRTSAVTWSVFDCSKLSTLDVADRLLAEALGSRPGMSAMLVGNKAGLLDDEGQLEVRELAEEVANRHGVKLVLVDAKEKLNVDRMMFTLARDAWAMSCFSAQCRAPEDFRWAPWCDTKESLTADIQLLERMARPGANHRIPQHTLD
eukprot:TRINITY_DN27146_c0_g1_i1.p1 TRINITY_DN27146_c0_g1~~TRINITY_DN27146_c0_g1_i1.p1  ORF type:complete len:248 (+),score=59.80 TRINITY_DN27146_c0_g1_i1:63-806(+)